MSDVLAWAALILVIGLLALRTHPRGRAWAPRGTLRPHARTPLPAARPADGCRPAVTAVPASPSTGDARVRTPADLH